jgi:hypothetical protein
MAEKGRDQLESSAASSGDDGALGFARAPGLVADVDDQDDRKSCAMLGEAT